VTPASGAGPDAWARDVEIAREIQRGFLPAALPAPPGWEVAAAFEPAREVSGDFYDAFPMADELRLGVVVGDVCGKGVGAALFMALFRSLIRAAATRVVRSGHTLVGDADSPLFGGLRLANDYIADVHGGANMFATVFAASIDVLGGAVRWVNAGHDPAPVLVGPDGLRLRLEPTGPALGLEVGARWSVGVARLRPGEALVAATDGVTEARDPAGTFFGAERLDVLCTRPAGGARAIAEGVAGAVRAFAGDAPPADDVTVLVVRRAG
jgi:serine phosphatase RsbU (regulator of sigma subunit)